MTRCLHDQVNGLALPQEVPHSSIVREDNGIRLRLGRIIQTNKRDAAVKDLDHQASVFKRCQEYADTVFYVLLGTSI